MAVPAIASAPKGVLVGKYCRALLVAQGDISSAHAFALGQGPAWREVAFALKAIYSGSVSEDTGAPTVASPISADLQDALRPRCVSRQAGPCARKTSATSRAGRPMAPPQDGGKGSSGPSTSRSKSVATWT